MLVRSKSMGYRMIVEAIPETLPARMEFRTMLAGLLLSKDLSMVGKSDEAVGDGATSEVLQFSTS